MAEIGSISVTPTGSYNFGSSFKRCNKTTIKTIKGNNSLINQTGMINAMVKVQLISSFQSRMLGHFSSVKEVVYSLSRHLLLLVIHFVPSSAYTLNFLFGFRCSISVFFYLGFISGLQAVKRGLTTRTIFLFQISNDSCPCTATYPLIKMSKTDQDNRTTVQEMMKGESQRRANVKS